MNLIKANTFLQLKILLKCFLFFLIKKNLGSLAIIANIAFGEWGRGGGNFQQRKNFSLNLSHQCHVEKKGLVFVFVYFSNFCFRFKSFLNSQTTQINQTSVCHVEWLLSFNAIWIRTVIIIADYCESSLKSFEVSISEIFTKLIKMRKNFFLDKKQS